MSQHGVTARDGSALSEESVDGFIARAFLRGAGHSTASLRRRPVVGIFSASSDLNPCNAGLADLAGAVRDGVAAADGLPVLLPTISISEPFVRPSSLLLRNLMAMDVEQSIAANPIDVAVLLGGCDKTVPAQLMGAISAGRPALALAAGPRPVQCWNGKPLTIDNVWPTIDRRRRGLVTDTEWQRFEGCLNGGPGTCNVMGTATTMAVVAEMLGFALPGTALLPASSAARRTAAELTGRRAVDLWRADRPNQVSLTQESLENAVRVTCALGGSTNALIHLAAIAGRAGLRADLAAVRTWCRTTPLLADVRPSGPHLLSELEELGGVPSVVAELGDLLHLGTPTAAGRNWAELVAELPSRRPSTVLRPLSDPIAPAAITVLSGSLAPAGAVLKRSTATARLLKHRGRAVVFDGVADLHARIDDPGLDVDADSVLVLRGAGPLGGPGMPEVGQLPIPARLWDAGVRDMVRISDARMSGTATGTVVLHVAPESAAGGPLALIRDGDLIVLDADAGRLDLAVDERELSRRRPVPRPGTPARGYERLHFEHVLQAPEGCDFDFLRG